MNFNLYTNKKVGSEITKMAQTLNRSRNSIIIEAFEERLENHKKKKWSKDFFIFDPIDDVPDFKETRKELKKNYKDPLA